MPILRRCGRAIENFARLPVGTAVAAATFDHKVLILGAMAELGPESLNEHRAIGRPDRSISLAAGRPRRRRLPETGPPLPEFCQSAAKPANGSGGLA